MAGGDFNGDGRADLIARDADGLLFMYRGNGRGGFITGQRERIGSGWSSLHALMLRLGPTAAAAPAPAPAAPPSAVIPDGRAKIRFTKGCTRPGGRLKVTPPHPPPRGPHPAARALRRLLRCAAAPSGSTISGRSSCACG